MDKKIKNAANQMKHITSVLYKDHDISRMQKNEIRHCISVNERKLLKADKSYDRKHKG